MKKITITVLVALLFSSGRLLSQEKPQGGAPAMPDMQEMMKKWMAAATPGEKHRALEPFVGEWQTTTKIFMGGPGSPPMETKGTATFKWVLDGRFLLQEVDGEMLMPDATGQMKSVPHKGMGLTGYDNYRNMYVGTWADNTGTQILTFAGAADPSGKVFTNYGEMDEPMLDVRGRMVKYVTRMIDAKKFIFEIYDLHAGPDFKVVEIVYTKS